MIIIFLGTIMYWLIFLIVVLTIALLVLKFFYDGVILFLEYLFYEWDNDK